VLAGYAFFRRDMLLYDNDAQDPAVVRQLLAELDKNNAVSRGITLPAQAVAPLEDVRRTLGFVPTIVEMSEGRLAGAAPLLTDEFRNQFAGCEHGRMLLDAFDVRRQLTGRSPVHIAMYLFSKTGLPRYILTVLGDRMEMAHSVEGRLPFLDHEVVELLTRMPVRLKIRGMTEKYALREAVRPELTETVYRRQKHPFLSPPAALHPDDKLYAMVNDTLRGPVMRSQPFFDQARVVGMLDRMHAMSGAERVVVDTMLMALLSTCVLQERFGLGN
jgi:asparagine synthase (glutamine-hydrolysing)